MTSLETLEGIWRSRPGGLAFAVLAEKLHEEGRTDQAAGILAEGVRRWPRSLSGRLVQGRIALEAGDVEGARVAYQAAVEMDGSCRAALEGFAEANARGQYFRQALDGWTRLSALEPDHPKARDGMRTAAQRLDTQTGGYSASVLVRDEDDPRSREALSEGASSHIPATQATIPAFKLDLSENLATPSGFPHLDAPTIPELPGFQIPSTPTGTSQSLLGRQGESSFATLEMPSFPARTIPPPPLELPKAAVAPPAPPPAPPVPQPIASPNIPTTTVIPAVPRFPTPEEKHDGEATQFFAAHTPANESKAPAGGRVTGDDIENRLDEVFGSTTSVVPALDPLSTSAPASTPALAAPRSGQVTGNDVEDRLGELFGESSVTPLMPAPPARPASPAAPQEPPPTSRILAPKTPEPATAEILPVVSGDDIEGRLDDLFGESVIDLTSPMEAKRPEDTSAMPVEDILPQGVADRSGDTAAVLRDTALEARLGNAGRPADSTAEMRTDDLRLGATQLLDQAIKGSEIDTTGSTIDLPTMEMPQLSDPSRGTRLTAEDVDSRLDELFASSEFLVEPGPAGRRTGFVSKTAAVPTGAVTGDDIEGRLDDLFGGDSDFPVGLPTVTFAEEYLRQGHKDKAANIYRQLLEKDPGNSELRRRLVEIEGQG